MNLSELLARDPASVLTTGEIRPVRLNDAVRRVHQKYPQVEISNEPGDLDERLEDFAGRLVRSDWRSIKWRHAAALARDFFGHGAAAIPRWTPLREMFLETLKETEKRSFAKACFVGYLQGFDKDADCTDALANALRHLQPALLAQFAPFINRFDALTPRGLVDRLSVYLAESDAPYAGLRELGISSPHMSGLFQAAYRRFVDRLEPELRRGDDHAIDRVLNWLHPETGFFLHEGKSYGIEAVVAPFSSNTPSDFQKTRLLDFFVNAYGDPRITKTKWHGVREDVVSILVSWLTGKSLKAFFEIISRFEGSHMWQPRRIFWERVFDAGRIDSAWVVLNREGQKYAQELSDQREDRTFLSFGKLDTNRSSDHTCYFIMKCGNALVVEGSHSFGLRFFKDKNSAAPKMFKKYYGREELVSRLSDERIPHLGDWENKARRALNRLG